MEDHLFELLEALKTDKKMREKILATKQAKDPMARLCEVATELGFPVTVGEIFASGEEYLCNLSDGRMGVTEPMSQFGDIYQQFFASVEGME